MLRGESDRPHWYEQAGHAVAFFYLRLADEVARVELPEWMATPERLAALHTLILDQCERGPGYPIALQEAHEAAVISSVDRAAFAALLERELMEQGIIPRTSAKSSSKRVRGI
jgi:NurA-like 5'-3' nuclease